MIIAYCVGPLDESSNNGFRNYLWVTAINVGHTLVQAEVAAVAASFPPCPSNTARKRDCCCSVLVWEQGSHLRLTRDTSLGAFVMFPITRIILARNFGLSYSRLNYHMYTSTSSYLDSATSPEFIPSCTKSSSITK